MRHRPTLADVPAAILAGGLATRLGSITRTSPKAMVEVAGRPFVDHQLSLLYRKGLRRVVLCLGHLGEQVRAHVGNGTEYGLEVRYSFDGEKLLGTGGALKRAAPLLGEVFWVLYGDSYMDIDYAGIHETFAKRQAMALMTVLHNGDRWDTSNVVFRDGRLLCYDKRQRRPDMNYIDYGAALLRQEALQRVPTEGAFDLADLYSDLIREGQMIGYEISERFFEIGSFRGLAETQVFLERSEVA